MILADIPWNLLVSPFGIPIVGVIAVFTWLTVVSISEAVTKVTCNRENTELKQQLLSRGYSAEEIIRVVEAGNKTPPVA